MSLRPQLVPTVPEETVGVVRALFPRGSLHMRLQDGWTDNVEVAVMPK